jgi:beta-lactamase regulating signal transducer with metallopeptidase domain
MLSEFFVTMIKMSLYGTLTILAVGLLLLILDWMKAPKYMCSLMCLVVVVRLLCPVGIPLPVGLFQLSPIESAVKLVQRVPESPVGNYEVHLQGEPDFDRAVAAGVTPREDNIIKTPVVLTKPNSTIPAEKASDKQIPILIWIWLAGCLGMAAYGIITYWMLKHKVASAVKCPQYGKNVYCSDQIPGPFVCGVIRPKIYLPLALREDELDYILLHEQTHIRRKDHLIKILYYLALCIHWFNPIVWNFQKLASAEMEYACDESVLKKTGEDIRANYSRSILNLSVGKKMIGSPLAFGEISAKERIQNILKYKKPTLAIIIAALALCIVVAAICIASPKQEDSAEAIIYSNLQVEADSESNGIISARILTDCAEGEAGTEVYIRRDDEKKGNWLDDIQPGEWLNIGYQVIEHDRDGGPETYVALDMASMDEYVSSFTLYRQGEAVQHNVLYNSFVNMQLPSLLLNSYDEEKSTSPYPDTEEFLRVEIGGGGFRVYFVYQKDGKFYVEHPMDYRSQISQETYNSLMAYLDKKELPNKSGDPLPEPASLESQITLLDIKALVEKAQGGQPLTWEDFKGYANGRDVGSGLYIVPYPVKDKANLTVLVGAMSPDGPIEYAYLISAFGEEEQRVDLTKCTYQEWADFVAAYGDTTVPEEDHDPVQTVEPTPSQSSVSLPAPVLPETPAKPDEPLTYFGAEVLEAYSYHPKMYTYHRIASKKQLETALKLLESGKTAAPKDKSEGGFLLMTSTGREEIYIDSQERELLTLCQNNNASEPGLVQWLVFMNPEKITKTEFIAASEYGADNNFQTDEQWALLQISDLLKSLKVDKTKDAVVQDKEGRPNTGSHSVLLMSFRTGVSYRIEVWKDGLDISSSDMGFGIRYSLLEGETDRLLSGLQQVSEKNPTYIFSISENIKPENIASINASGSMEKSSFHVETVNARKMERLYHVLCTMRVCKQEYNEGIMVNPIISPKNGFVVSIKLKNDEQWVFQAEEKELAVYKINTDSYTSCIFTEGDYQAFYDALSQAAQ